MTSSLVLRAIAAAGWAMLVASSVCAQSTAPAPGRFSLQAHYGANGNFFTSSQVSEYAGEYTRTNFLGTAGGGHLAYRLSPSSTVALEYTRTVNSRPVRFTQYIGPYGYPQESDLRIRYINNAFQAVYERQFSAQSNWKYHAGLLYMTTASQTLYTGRYTSVSETNRRNSYAEEAGVVAGLEYSRPLDTHFRLGLRARGYYLISVTTLEMVTLTPTLTYTF